MLSHDLIQKQTMLCVFLYQFFAHVVLSGLMPSSPSRLVPARSSPSAKDAIEAQSSYGDEENYGSSQRKPNPPHLF
jgi:hypothetical protein